MLSKILPEVTFALSPSPHLTIDILYLITLLNRSSVGSQSPLGKFIHSLLSASTSSFQHIEEALFVGTESNYFRNELTNQLGSLGNSLQINIWV